MTVNGVSLEPTILSFLYDKIESIVDKEAKKLFDNHYSDKVGELNRQIWLLQDIVKESANKIADKFDIKID